MREICRYLISGLIFSARTTDRILPGAVIKHNIFDCESGLTLGTWGRGSGGGQWRWTVEVGSGDGQWRWTVEVDSGGGQ